MNSNLKVLKLFGILELVFGAFFIVFLFVINKNLQSAYLLSGVFSVIFGICLLRTAFNPSSYKPAWILGLIDVIINAIGLIIAFTMKSTSNIIITTIIDLFLGVFILITINKVKNNIE